MDFNNHMLDWLKFLQDTCEVNEIFIDFDDYKNLTIEQNLKLNILFTRSSNTRFVLKSDELNYADMDAITLLVEIGNHPNDQVNLQDFKENCLLANMLNNNPSSNS